MGSSQKGKAAPAYGTGRSVSMRSGYVRIREPDHPLAMKDGYVFEHRKVVFDAGIEVAPGYQVHHRDGDKTNNDLANLVVMANGEHQREHSQIGAVRKNQYGTFVVGTPEERRERGRAISRENQRKRRMGLRFDRATLTWFDSGTHRSVGGDGTPADDSPHVQDAAAAQLLSERGLAPWPPAMGCR